MEISGSSEPNSKILKAPPRRTSEDISKAQTVKKTSNKKPQTQKPSGRSLPQLLAEPIKAEKFAIPSNITSRSRSLAQYIDSILLEDQLNHNQKASAVINTALKNL